MVSPRLIHQSLTEMIIMLGEIMLSLDHRISLKLRETGNNDTGKLSYSMRIDSQKRCLKAVKV